MSPRGPRLALVALVVAGCGDGAGLVVAPVIEVPSAGAAGYSWPGVTDLDVSLTRDSDGVVVRSASAAVGQRLELFDVDFDVDLVLHVSGRDRQVETAYGRSCAFAIDEATAASGEAELRVYFARVLRWAAGAAPLAPARTSGVAYATADGRGVFLGGGADGERFDPQDGGFHPLALATVARVRPGLVGLADGRALLSGGVDAGGDGIPTLEVLDPGPDAPSVETLDGPRLVDHTATALTSGDVLLAGGRSQGAPAAPFVVSRGAYLIHLGDGGRFDAPRPIGDGLAFGRAEASATRLGDDLGADVLLIGGRDQAGLPVAQAELYRPLRGVFEQVAAALLIYPRWGHVAVRMPGGFVLVVGGLAPDPGGGAPVPVDVVELYDPAQGRFAIAGQLPVSAGLTELTATPLPDGRVLLAGGRGRDGAAVDTAIVAAFDPLTGQVTLSPTDRMEAARAGHAAVRLCDGTVLVVGGTGEPGVPGAERYDPSSSGR